jgi:hypothetical protein
MKGQIGEKMYSYTLSLTSALNGSAVVTRRFILGDDPRYR